MHIKTLCSSLKNQNIRESSANTGLSSSGFMVTQFTLVDKPQVAPFL
ncbi:hypothetical protein Mal52_49470 [Symmachiella dynata]|uniref:Uncharacterized protein n=1 Tax=Symmachiella dynata TaxID=2527995 RepID=A0A517ZVB8_9PLAN|nr:hypothetical protein Mal52_49470 [Symmachiella dynata]